MNENIDTILKELSVLSETKRALQTIQGYCNITTKANTDSSQEEESIMSNIKKRELELKKQAVLKVHVTKNGKPRSISQNSTKTDHFPNGVWFTKVEGGKLFRAKDEDTLYLRLFDYYFGDDTESYSVQSIFEQALSKKQQIENPKEGTLRRYRYEFKKFISTGFQQKDIRDITADYLMEYTQNLVNSMSPTKKRYLSYKGVLNLIFGYAVERGFIKNNPVKKIINTVYLKSCDCRKPDAEEKILSPEEIQSLIDASKKRTVNRYYIMYYAMVFSIHTGCRVGEICSLKWSDIDYDNMSIHIHTQQLSLDKSGRCKYYLVNYTKNERGVSNGGRYFPLTDDILSILKELKDLQKSLSIESEFVFCYPDGSWITTRGYCCYIRSLCRKLGLKVNNNHAFRMSLNSNVLIPNGISVTDRAKLLGHSVETNLKYYSFAQKDYLDNTRSILNGIKKHGEPFLTFGEPCKTIPFKAKRKPVNG